MSYTRFQFWPCAAVVCLLALSPALADDSKSSSTKDNEQSQAAQKWIDELSSKVDLSSEQKDQIRQQLDANSDKIESTWRQFSEANAKAIALEASLYAAIEDEMTEQQKTQFRKSRQEKQSHASDASGQRRSTQQAGDSTNQDRAQAQANTAQRDQSDATAATKRNSANSEKASNQNAANAKNASNSDSAKTASRGAQQGQAGQKLGESSEQNDATYYYVTETIIVPVQALVSDVDMNDQQRQQCDEACQKFHQKLHQAWSDVSRLHDQLVQLEAEKLQAVEKILNEEQLKKLKNDRKNG